MILEKMTGFVHKRDSRAELKQQISRPISGSFVHVDASQGASFAPTNSEDVPAIPPMPAMHAMGPLVPDRPPPPVPIASQPNARQSIGTTHKDLEVMAQYDPEPTLERDDIDKETDLHAAAQNLRYLANAALTDEVKFSFLNTAKVRHLLPWPLTALLIAKLMFIAKDFTDTKILVRQAKIAMLKAQEHADEAACWYEEAKVRAFGVRKIARNMRPSADLSDEMETPPRPRLPTELEMSPQPKLRANLRSKSSDQVETPLRPKPQTGLRTKTRTEIQTRR